MPITHAFAQAAVTQFEQKPYQLVHISVLREYLMLELHVPNLPFAEDKVREAPSIVQRARGLFDHQVSPDLLNSKDIATALGRYGTLACE